MLNLSGVKYMSKHYITIALTSSLLTACGGGGGGGGSTEGSAPTEAFTGSFIDSPVEGLRYETLTQSGLTNSLGEFTYLKGESVTFYIGGTQLGVTQGANIVTPFSLLGITPLTTEAEISTALTTNRVNSFDRAINIATLLQTLDIDGDPENGINLGTSHEDLKDLKIPLVVKASAFEQQSAVDSARDLTGVSHDRTLSNSIQHIYSSLGIEVKSSLTSSYTSTQNNKQIESVSFNYNAEGKLTSKNIDTNNDGEIDASKTYGYDNNGNLDRITNSASNTVETLNYNNDNKLLSRFIDSKEGNDLEESYLYTDGQLDRFELDHNADGSIDTSTHYTYDNLGNLSSYEVDRDGDGTTDSIASYSYLNNTLSSYSEDNDNDGIPNIIIAYTYDSNGSRTSQNVDLSTEGAPNSLGSFEYDSQNNPTRYEQDRDLDGNPDYIEAYAYDQNNNRTFYKRDLDADGTWDVVTNYFYDINGNRIKMIEDSDGNGLADKVWTGDYQAAVLNNTWNVILDKL